MYYLSRIARVQRRISLMSEDIKNKVIDQVKSAGSFALQLYDSTNVSSCAQLMAFVRYVHSSFFPVTITFWVFFLVATFTFTWLLLEWSNAT